MEPWNCIIIISTVISAILAGIIIPKIRFIAFSRKLFDIPDGRKLHTEQIPRLGGLAFNPIIIFVLFLVLGAENLLESGSVMEAFASDCTGIAFGLCAVMLMYVIGLADDLIGVRYRVKFAVQFLGALFLIFGGLYVRNLYGLLFLDELPYWLGVLVSVFLIVFITNAVNFIDGIDGLASGLCMIVLLVYGVSFYCFDLYFYSLLSFVALGVLAPFFYYNVFGSAAREKKIFMGDTGSLTIGMLICFLSLKLLNAVPQNMIEEYNPVALAFSPLIIPCLDAARVSLIRVYKRKNPFLPDRNHIHHKLLDAGVPKYMILVLIFMASVLITIFNILVTRYINVTFVIVLNCLLWSIVNIYLSISIKRKIWNHSNE